MCVSSVCDVSVCVSSVCDVSLCVCLVFVMCLCVCLVFVMCLCVCVVFVQTPNDRFCSIPPSAILTSAQFLMYSAITTW